MTWAWRNEVGRGISKTRGQGKRANGGRGITVDSRGAIGQDSIWRAEERVFEEGDVGVDWAD